MSVFGFTDVFDLSIELGRDYVNIKCKNEKTADRVESILDEEDVKHIRLGESSNFMWVERFGYDHQHLAEKLAIGFESLGYVVERKVVSANERTTVESFLVV